MQKVTLEMRKRVSVKVGDTLIFSPGIEAIAGPDSRFFKKYAGMKAKVLSFDESGISTFRRMLAKTAGNEEPKKVIGRFFVRFENGDTPKEPINSIHFLVQ